MKSRAKQVYVGVVLCMYCPWSFFLIKSSIIKKKVLCIVCNIVTYMVADGDGAGAEEMSIN